MSPEGISTFASVRIPGHPAMAPPLRLEEAALLRNYLCLEVLLLLPLVKIFQFWDGSISFA